MKYYIYILFLLTSFASIAQKHTVYPKILRELADYSSPEGDAGKLPGFFNLRGYLSPIGGNTTPPGGIDTIPGLPRKMFDSYFPSGTIGGINWPGNRGLRIIFDFTGALNMNDTTNRVNITDLYGWYNANLEAGDTLYFYNLDTMMRFTPENRVQFLARPDSLLKPFAKLRITNHFTGLLDSAVGLNQTLRYMMVRAVRINHGSFTTEADFSELVFYGTYNYDTLALVTRPPVWTGPVPVPVTYGAFNGSNFGQGFDTLQQNAIGLNRTYGSLSYWDNTSSQTTTAAATFVFDHFSDIGPAQYPFYKRTGKKFWWSIKGASEYLNNTHPGTNLNTDNWNGDPESANYTRDGKFYFNYAAKWGSVAVPSGKTAWTGDGSFPNGQNTIYYVENGNEDNFYTSGLCYAMRSFADYDSLHAADPNFKLIMSGTTELDTCFMDNLIWFCKILRSDQKVVWNIWNFHHYPRTCNIIPYAPTLAQQVGVHVQSPEGDVGIGLYNFYDKGARSLFNYLQDTVQIWNTEYGSSNWGTPATSEAQAGLPWDLGNVPSNASWDSIHFKAILEMRSQLIMPFTPIRGYNQFFFQNSNNSATNFPNLFLSNGMVATPSITPPFAATTFFPNWYYNQCVYPRMKWYTPISTVGQTDTTGLCHQLWRKIDSTTGALTDSVCDVIWKTSMQGAVAFNQTVVIGYRKGNTTQKMVPSLSSTVGTTSSFATTGNSLFLTTQDEQPTFFFATLAPNPNYWLFRRPTVLK